MGGDFKRCGVFFQTVWGSISNGVGFSNGVGKILKMVWGKFEKRGGENMKNGVGKNEKYCGEKYVWEKLKNEM